VSPRLVSILSLGVACALAPAQSATIHLTHDAADGEVRPGDVVTWTLSVAFTGAEACGGGNLRLVANNPWLVESSDFEFNPWIWWSEGGPPDGVGGISLINWNNSLFLDGFHGDANRSNPFVAGTFITTATGFGVLEYQLGLGELDLPFLTIDQNAFAFTTFSRDEVTIEVQPLRIGEVPPEDHGFDPTGTDESCENVGLEAATLGGGIDGGVLCMLELPDGDLIVGGDFDNAGGVTTSGIARWDGASWHPIGSGLDGSVRALSLLPNGDLVAGGTLRTSGQVGDTNVARWDGTAWAGVGEPFRMIVNALVVLPNGDLVAGGGNSSSTYAYNGAARWDGSSWQAIGGGTYSAYSVADLLVMPDGDLIAGGTFLSMGAIEVNYMARWDGVTWHGLADGLSSYARSLALSPEGELVVGGYFDYAGVELAYGVARWDGESWASYAAGPTGPGVRQDYAGIQEIGFLPTGELFVTKEILHGPKEPLYVWNGTEWSTGYDVHSVRASLVPADGTLILGTAEGIYRWGTLTLPPQIFKQPLSAEICPFGGATLAVYSEGPDALTYRWQIADAGVPGGWRSLLDGPDPGLGSVSGADAYRLRLFGPIQDATVRCIVSNPCGDTVSDAAALVVDTAGCCDHIDFTGDGVLDGADLAEFVSRYLANDSTADLNADFLLDLGDLQVFVYLYLSGCG